MMKQIIAKTPNNVSAATILIIFYFCTSKSVIFTAEILTYWDLTIFSHEFDFDCYLFIWQIFCRTRILRPDSCDLFWHKVKFFSSGSVWSEPYSRVPKRCSRPTQVYFWQMMLLEMKKYFHRDFLQKRLNFKETILFPVRFWNCLGALSSAAAVLEGSRQIRIF